MMKNGIPYLKKGDLIIITSPAKFFEKEHVVFSQKYLESKGKRYIMMDTFGNHQDKQRQSNGLISQVNDQYYIGWPTESMMEWTYKTPQGPAGHFLEEGHQKVAEKINEYIRNIGWVS